MAETDSIINYNLLTETRLTKVEANYANIQEDIREIKRNFHWLMGLVFSLNTTIIGLLAKGFNII